MNKRLMSITKVFTFDSAHHLNDYEGKCKYTHGHTYKLEVTLKGPIDKNGFVIDFHDLNRIVEDEVISVVDHKYLNDIFDFNPTCELLGLWIWDKMEVSLKRKEYFLEKVVLWETPTSFITIDRKDMV
ncbi:MAG TPA: 6-carboxytetrahydropterin synthase QueD [Pseudobacteroides sp.]|uniref:6-carboxytetrahydropterin synthase QueD n=1 Tax=Pseudobacteroides sp. TaxID=1968840 RepID=UPI002F94A66C